MTVWQAFLILFSECFILFLALVWMDKRDRRLLQNKPYGESKVSRVHIVNGKVKLERVV